MPGAKVFYGACTYLHPYADDDDDDRGICSARDGRLDGSGAAGGGGQHRRHQERERSRSAQNFGLACLLACLLGFHTRHAVAAYLFLHSTTHLDCLRRERWAQPRAHRRSRRGWSGSRLTASRLQSAGQHSRLQMAMSRGQRLCSPKKDAARASKRPHWEAQSSPSHRRLQHGWSRTRAATGAVPSSPM